MFDINIEKIFALAFFKFNTFYTSFDLDAFFTSSFFQNLNHGTKMMVFKFHVDFFFKKSFFNFLFKFRILGPTIEKKIASGKNYAK